MLDVAVALAVAIRADAVAFGAHAGDHAVYPAPRSILRSQSINRGLCDAMMVSYFDLAGEYDQLLGRLAEQTWRHGVLPEVIRVGVSAGAVVDLGAGTGIGGRLLARAARGARRIAVDRSASMLHHATGWYEQLVLADLTRLPLRTESVDLMVSGFDTLNYLDRRALERCLRETSRCLRLSGWLIFDYSSPQLLGVHWRDLSYSEQVPGGIVHWRHHYEPDLDRCVSGIERRDLTGSVRWRETHIQYALPDADLQRLAAAAGLRLKSVRDLGDQRFTSTAHTHVWTLQKGDEQNAPHRDAGAAAGAS